MVKARTAALICLAVLALAGCDGADGGDTDAGTSASASASASSGGSGTGDSGTGDGGSEQGAVSGAKLCDYLRGELPGLKAKGDEISAQAQLVMGLAGWYDQQGGKVPNGPEIEKLTREQCPDVRTEVLKATGVSSFVAM